LLDYEKWIWCDAGLEFFFNAQMHGGEYAPLQPPEIRFN